MGLKDWLRNAWLIEHKADPLEIQHLLRLADRDLADCRNESLSLDWRFNIAYNAALQCATAALAAAGYRAAKEAHHYRVIQSLRYTLGLDEKLILNLDAFRKKRNISEYDRAGSITRTELKAMISLANELRQAVEKKAIV